MIDRRSFLAKGLAASLSLLPLGLSSVASAATETGTLLPPRDEDGYECWLRYREIRDPLLLQKYSSAIENVVVDHDSPVSKRTQTELTNALRTILGKEIRNDGNLSDGSVQVLIGRDAIDKNLSERLGDEGFSIKRAAVSEKKLFLISANTSAGAMYGAFRFLKGIQTGEFDEKFPDIDEIVEMPYNPLRLLWHGDNPDGTMERGYSGKSLWKWSELPDSVDPRIHDYARLNASLGINGDVINNVNAPAEMLSTAYIAKAKALADVFREYGIKLYLCINFASPIKLSNLKTADPLDQEVIAWWHDKCDEIYRSIPDFGGFLVKANSEGQPGPQNYKRTHAEGANMLARALKPHGGIVMWRAFVYTDGLQNEDRVKRAYLEFKPLDGKFDDNAIVQMKNGPLDFMPREPFHPLFGAIPRTRQMAELEITQEYTGQSTHLVYLGTEWQEVLHSRTFQTEKNSEVYQVIQSQPEQRLGGFSGYANTGQDRNWCGHHFAQANWYAFGRMAWDPTLDSSTVAADWAKMTWSKNDPVWRPMVSIMNKSYEAYVNYTMPLGLHHMVGGDHYAPLPEGEGDPRGIFHHAAEDGIGYDRTRKTGSDAVDQYHAPLNDIFNDPSQCPEKFLLWFHHLPWTHKMKSGRNLWEELCFKYDLGIRTAKEMHVEWQSLKDTIDNQRFAEVEKKLQQQANDAEAWSDKCLNYFSQYSKMKRVRFIS